MKQLFLSVTLLSLCASQASAQAVVSAPVLEAQAGVQTVLQKAMKALSSAANKLVNQGVGEQKLTKMFSEQNMKMAKNWYDGLQQVSGAVRDYRRVRMIFFKQNQIITQYSQAVEVLRKSAFIRPEQLTAMTATYAKMLLESSHTIEDLATVTSPAMLKMTDAERMRFIDQLDKKITEQADLMDYFTRRNMMMMHHQQQQSVDEQALSALIGK
jgi:hypothetical protein